MAFGPKPQPVEKPKPLGLDAKKTSTHEQARPVPYFCGKSAPIAGTFVGEPWAVRTDPVTKRAGKKNTVTGYQYTLSFVVVFCHGVVDSIEGMYSGDSLLWQGPLNRGDSLGPYVEITVESRGTVRFYWGGEDQNIDPDLEASGYLHSAYRGQCYAVFLDWKLAEGQASVDNIQVLLTRYPTASFWPSDLPRSIEGDINPMIPVVEWWTSTRYGVGLGVGRLDTEKLLVTASTLNDEGFGLSPFITSQSTMSATLGKLIEYFDGFTSVTPEGKLWIGLRRGTIGTPPVFNESHIVGSPELENSGWADTFSETTVRFSNRSVAFNPDSVTWRDSANYQVTGISSSTTVNREWITRQYVAWMAAVSAGRQYGRPKMTGTMKLRLSAAVQIAPGDQFFLTYSGHNVSALLCRVLRWRYASPKDAHVTVQFEEDLGYLNGALSPVNEDDFGDPVTYEAAEAFAQRAFELPWGMTGSRDVTVQLHVVRGDTLCTGFLALWEVSTANFVEQGRGDAFAQKGTLALEFPSTVLLEDPAVKMRITLTCPDKLVTDLVRTEALTNRKLHIFVGSEILVGWDPVLVSSGTWDFSVARAQYDTAVQSHSSGSEVYLLQEFTGDAFRQVVPALTVTQKFKAQPFLLSNFVELVACPEMSMTPVLRAYAPLCPANPTANGDGINPTYGTGADVIVDWDETSEEWIDDNPDTVHGSRADSTIIQILTTSDVLAHEVTVTGVAGPSTLTNADLITWLGSEVSFHLRIYYSLGGVRSINYASLAVTKV